MVKYIVVILVIIGSFFVWRGDVALDVWLNKGQDFWLENFSQDLVGKKELLEKKKEELGVKLEELINRFNEKKQAGEEKIEEIEKAINDTRKAFEDTKKAIEELEKSLREGGEVLGVVDEN